MRAAPDEIDAVKILEAIARPQVQHLVEGVREVEGRAAVDLVLPIPIVRRDDPFEADASLDIGESRLRNLPQHQRAEALAFARPIDVRMLVRDRREHVERAHPARRERRVGDARILDVKGGILGEDVPVFDLVEVARVVGRDVDVVMRKIEARPRRRDTS